MRTTVVIPDELKKRVLKIAAERGVSMGQLVREALEEKVSSRHPKPHAAVFASGHTDTSRLAGEIRPEPRSWR